MATFSACFAQKCNFHFDIYISHTTEKKTDSFRSSFVFFFILFVRSYFLSFLGENDRRGKFVQQSGSTSQRLKRTSNKLEKSKLRKNIFFFSPNVLLFYFVKQIFISSMRKEENKIKFEKAEKKRRKLMNDIKIWFKKVDDASFKRNWRILRVIK